MDIKLMIYHEIYYEMNETLGPYLPVPVSLISILNQQSPYSNSVKTKNLVKEQKTKKKVQPTKKRQNDEVTTDDFG